MARWDNEKLRLRSPNIDKIPCKDCKYRERDRTIGGKLFYGAIYGVCEKYRIIKPIDVLDGESPCVEYEKDTDFK